MAAYTKKTPYSVFGWLLLKSVFGAFILRSSACTVNDILDKNFDAAVGGVSVSVLTREMAPC